MYILTLEKVTSGSEQLKNVYEVGEHVIGRGPELQCTSKKVSRKHALIKVTENDGVFLESTHNNPCFHQLKNTKNIEIITFSKSIKLSDEDKISLALDHGWFIVKISNSNQDINNKRDLENDEESEAKKIKLNNDVLNTNNENTAELHIVETEITEENNTADAEVIEENNTEAEVTAKNDAIETEVTENISLNTEVKQEPLDESTIEPEIKQESPDTSTEITVKNEPENNTDNNAASTSLGNTSSRRDRCWYGSSCYRKNPTHRASFSHPNDTDYDSDPNDTRPICCYGINCYRRNKLHREKYRHPGQDKVPDPPSKKKRKQDKSPKTNETKKRTKTNTIQYYDDEEDDYDLDDPFINDGDTSDEYEPESSDTESDEEVSSQSQNTEEIEETKQLLKDARKFTRKK